MVFVVFIVIGSIFKIQSKPISISKMEGIWLNSKYLNTLKKEFSLKKLCEKIVPKDPLTGLIITNRNDSTFVTITYGLSEGVEYVVYSVSEVADKIFMELGQDGKPMNEKLEFHMIDNKIIYKKLNKSTTFEKIKYSSDNDGEFERVFNDILLSGTFSNDKNKFTFNDSGTLLINEEHCKYRIIIDCSLEQDVMEVEKNSETIYYIFSRSKKYLKLWRAKSELDMFVKKEKTFMLLKHNN